MSRLIREEDVIREIDKWLDNVGTAYVGKGLSYYGELLGCIEDAPTAYDVEAVVKQIEEFVECNDECSKTFYQGRGCKACAYKEIIEIVRMGGVSNE